MNSLEPNSLLPKNFKALPRKFYLRKTTEVAKDLLGKGLYFKTRLGLFLAEIVEVEAYLSEKDPASHSHRGITKRNWAMFEPGGTCYVYICYGINFCVNVSTREAGVGEAVLIRAAIPILGIEQMHKNRGLILDNRPQTMKNLLSGPGKLTQGFGINLRQNGLSFDREDLKMIDLGRSYSEKEIAITPRVGISKAKDLKLRFKVG